MTAPAGDPAYNANTWKIGYQTRQAGVAGPDVLPSMAFPPAAMVAAAGAEVTPKE